MRLRRTSRGIDGGQARVVCVRWQVPCAKGANNAESPLAYPAANDRDLDPRRLACKKASAGRLRLRPCVPPASYSE